MATSPHILARIKEKGLRQSTLRNGGMGFVIGSILLATRFNKMRRNPSDLIKFKERWISYLMRVPIFFSTFTILYKGLRKVGTQLAGGRGLTPNGKRKPLRRFMLALTSLFCGYCAQRVAPVFNWNYALYVFMRAAFALCCMLIPSKYLARPQDVWIVVHGIFPYFITYNACFISGAFAQLFMRVYKQDLRMWTGMYSTGDMRGNHQHGIISPCKRCVHLTNDPSCLKSFFLDGFEIFKSCFVFYIKLFGIATILRSMRKIIKDPVSIVSIVNKIFVQSWSSTLFLFIAFHPASRIHCLYTWLLEIYHKKIRKDECAPIAANNMFMMFVASAIVGGYCIKFEPRARQADICLISVWRIVEHWMLLQARVVNLKKEKEDAHFILGSEKFPAVLFALACAILVYIHASNPKALKSLEKTVLKYALA